MHIDVLATLADAMGVPITSMGGKAVSPIADLKAS
jgi:arylsulfatase A-like enzyme